MDRWKVQMCPKLLSSYRAHMRPHSIGRKTAAPTTPAQPEIGASSERKDLLPWPIKTRKRGSSSLAMAAVKAAEDPSNPPPGKELTSSTSMSSSWSFTDLPPKKRILLAAQARRVDQFMCVICGRVFEDYHALGGHKSQHRKRASPVACPGTTGAVVACKRVCTPLALQRCCGTTEGIGGNSRHCKVLPTFDINEVPHPDGEEETLALPWYDRFPVET